jgi:hypothetical protein
MGRDNGQHQVQELEEFLGDPFIRCRACGFAEGEYEGEERVHVQDLALRIADEVIRAEFGGEEWNGSDTRYWADKVEEVIWKVRDEVGGGV